MLKRSVLPNSGPEGPCSSGILHQGLADARRLFGLNEYLLTCHPLRATQFVIPIYTSPNSSVEDDFNLELKYTMPRGPKYWLLDQWCSLKDTSQLGIYGIGCQELGDWVQVCCLLSNYTYQGFVTIKDGFQDQVVHILYLNQVPVKQG